MFKKTLAIITAFAMILSFAACSKNDEELKKSNMVYNGHEVYTDENGQHYYTDADGNKVEVDAEDVQHTEYNNGESSSELTPDQEAILDMMADLEENPDMFAEEIPVPELDSGNELIPEDSFNEIDVELNEEGTPDHGETAKSYQEILAGGKFTIEVLMVTSVEGVSTTIPFTIVKDGNMIAMEAVAPTDETGTRSMRMKYLVKDGVQYCILPAMKMYFSLGSAEDIESLFSGDMVDSITSSNMEGLNYVSSGEVTVGDKVYICDVYETEDGTVKKDYFLNGTLARMETITPDGQSTIVEYKTITDTVDASVFTLPSNYIDATSIMGSDMLY